MNSKNVESEMENRSLLQKSVTHIFRVKGSNEFVDRVVDRTRYKGMSEIFSIERASGENTRITSAHKIAILV